MKNNNNKQSKKASAIEATANTLIGLVVSFAIQIIMYPLLGIPVTINQSLLLTGVFFVASVIRGYFVRRLFNNLFNKNNK